MAFSRHLRGARRIGASAALALAAALLALAASSGGASAHALIPTHAKLTHADPAPGAVLKSAPTTITLQFAEEMKPDGSDIIVYDGKGDKVSTGAATVDRSDTKTMKVDMRGGDSEVYVVVWHNVSAADGDPDAGSYEFTVSADATPSSGHQPGSEAEAGGSGGIQPLVAALIGVLGLVVGGAGGFFLARRRAA